MDRILAIGGVLLGLLGIVAAWYFYRAALPTRIPTFLVDPVRATLVDRAKSASSDITILYKGSPIGPRAVNVVRVYFWNSGNTPITKAEVLTPFRVKIKGDSTILDTKIIKVNRDVTGITFASVPVPQLSPPANSAPAGKRSVRAPAPALPPSQVQDTAILNFELLEADDGAALQLTYAGPKEADFEFTGSTIGAPSPTVKQITQQIVAQQVSQWVEIMRGFGTLLFSIFVGFTVLGIIVLSIRPVRILTYRRIFRSAKTDDEIAHSALAALPWFGGMLIGASLLSNLFILTASVKVIGEIPSSLLVQD